MKGGAGMKKLNKRTKRDEQSMETYVSCRCYCVCGPAICSTSNPSSRLYSPPSANNNSGTSISTTSAATGGMACFGA